MNPSEYETLFRLEDRHWWYHALRAMLLQYWAVYAPSRPLRVLDVGCGTGANAAALRDHAWVAGVDIGVEALRMAKTRGPVTFVNASALELPFASWSFDVVLSMDVLCHKAISDKIGALTEIGRVLKSEGLLFLNLPAYQWLYSSHDRAVHTDRRFTITETRSILSQAGFRTPFVTYWNSFLLPPMLVSRVYHKAFPASRSDLGSAGDSTAQWIAAPLLRLERALLRRLPLPAGLSIFAVAGK